MKKEILKFHAEFCKTFAPLTRLETLNLLKDEDLIVNDITDLACKKQIHPSL